MAYRLTYNFSMDWIGPGTGPSAGAAIYGAPSSGNAQTLTVFNKAGGQTISGSTTYTPPGGTAISGAIATGDITTLVNAAATDIIAQLQAATPAALAASGSGLNNPPLPQMQAWVAGNP